MLSGYTSYGAMAETTCDTGHIPSEIVIFCEEHGFWSNATCILAGKYLLKLNLFVCKSYENYFNKAVFKETERPKQLQFQRE